MADQAPNGPNGPPAAGPDPQAPESAQDPAREPQVPRSPLSRLAAFVVLRLLKFYQRYVSPLKPPTCRFYPTCSAYAVGAFSQHGFFLAFWLSLKRLLRCHPFSPGGYDPVPPGEKPKPGPKAGP
jgi:putative membrane protein insertion efficiency factor